MKPEDYMIKATRALASAKLLLETGDCDGACNRAYYAMFNAAHAAIFSANSNVNPATIKTHRGLIAAFGEHLVKTGLLPVEPCRVRIAYLTSLAGAIRGVPLLRPTALRPYGPDVLQAASCPDSWSASICCSFCRNDSAPSSSPFGQHTAPMSIKQRAK